MMERDVRQRSMAKHAVAKGLAKVDFEKTLKRGVVMFTESWTSMKREDWRQKGWGNLGEPDIMKKTDKSGS